MFLGNTPTERTKINAENKRCFSCFKGNHSFRQCPQPRACNRDDCSISHNSLLHGAERVFQPRTTPKTSRNQVTSSCSSTIPNSHTGESSGVCSVTDMKGLLQITEVEVQAGTNSTEMLALWDCACSHS